MPRLDVSVWVREGRRRTRERGRRECQFKGAYLEDVEVTVGPQTEGLLDSVSVLFTFSRL